MFCDQCGTKLNENAKFCSNCGSPVLQKIEEDAPMTLYEALGSSQTDKDTSFLPEETSYTQAHGYTTPRVSQPPRKTTPAKKPPQKKRHGCLTVFLWVIVVFVVLIFIAALFSASEDSAVEISETYSESTEAPTSSPETDEERQEPETPEDGLAFLDDFTEYGYSAEQIAEMKTVLTNVGIVEVTDLEIQPVVAGMQVVKGVAFKGESLMGPRDDVQIQFNIENGVLYYIHIYCPFDNLSGLEDRRAELYYDTYLKKINWENKAVIDYKASPGTTYIGSSCDDPIILTASELAAEIDADIDEAKEKYNGKWVEITGKISDTSDGGEIYGYYIYGESITTGYSGLRIICWCDDGPYSGSVKGDTRTFLGYLREVSALNSTEITNCEIVDP